LHELKKSAEKQKAIGINRPGQTIKDFHKLTTNPRLVSEGLFFSLVNLFNE